MGNPVVHSHRPEMNYRIVDTGGDGGKIHVEEQKVPGMGKFALFTDPEGRMMGLWKAKR
jgi:predicted enzyme related to lactoylglutathione lyase